MRNEKYGKGDCLLRKMMMMMVCSSWIVSSVTAFVVTKRPVGIASKTVVSSLYVTQSEKNDEESLIETTKEQNNNDNVSRNKKKNEMEMPWGERQEWALRDNISKYLITIPNNDDDDYEGDEVVVVRHNFALWRSMIRDVPELTGYPVKYVQKMYQQQQKMESKDVLPGIMPFLDQFEFTQQGGISGRSYGLAGIADGTLIETSSVKGVQSTIPDGYIITESGVPYELGIPLGDFYSLDGSGNTAARAQMQKMLQSTSIISKSMTETGANLLANGVSKSDNNNIIDSNLVNLGATTAILLGGATAFNMLSHHLTVNVFWV